MLFPSEATPAEIAQHHIWLSRLNAVLSEIAPDAFLEEGPQLITGALAPADIPARQSYPNWPCDFRLEEAGSLTSEMSARHIEVGKPSLPGLKALSTSAFELAVAFVFWAWDTPACALSSLRWRLDS